MTARAAPTLRSETAIRNARVVLRVPDALPTTSWARATALFGRQAIEFGMDELWADVEPDMRRVRNKKAQFISLRRYLDPDLAGRVWFTWGALSDACHHHAYELPPTETELQGWLETIEEFLAAVRERRSG